MQLNNKKGFTLIELLVVTTIIGVMAAIAIPSFLKYKTRAYDSEPKSHLHNIFVACKAYWGDNGSARNCNISVVSMTAYGFLQSSDVSIAANGNENIFLSSASHTQSTNTFTINSRGAIN